MHFDYEPVAGWDASNCLIVPSSPFARQAAVRLGTNFAMTDASIICDLLKCWHASIPPVLNPFASHPPALGPAVPSHYK
jgi:hypothetical protein